MPNFEASPPEAAHFPEPVAETFTRTPKLGTNSKFFGMRQQRAELGVLFEDRNDVLSQLLADQQQPDHHGIFVAIADQQRAIVFEMRQRGDEFRLGAAFQAETKGPARFENLLHDFVKLVHFDRIHADIGVLVSRLLDGFLERVVEFGDARSEKILKADKQWELDALGFQILDNLVEIDADRIAEDRAERCRFPSSLTAK